MKKLLMMAFALFAAGTAHAGIPLLNVSCTDKYEVHADEGGPVFINGKKTQLKKVNDNYYEATGSGITVSIAINPDGSPNVSYTGKHGIAGICQASESGGSGKGSNSGDRSSAAQDSVPGLQDLVGARGSSGEQALQDRGYKFVKGEKSGGASYTYWRNTRTGQCIVVRTANGRYESLVKALEMSCRDGSTETAPTEDSDKHGSRFATVGGVIVDGKTYRYKCTVEGAAPGGSGKTVLHYPDQNITLNWRGGKRVNVTFEGMKAQPATFSTSEGNTQFVFEDKTYFYTSDPGAAEMEVKHFKGQ
jgi:hypothetical protein